MKDEAELIEQTHVIKNGEDGLVGNPNGVDRKSSGYKKLQDAIKARYSEFTETEKREIEFNAIRYKMLSYIESEDYSKVIEPGEFIRLYLKAAGVKQNAFASFINTNPGNLGKLLNGERRINHETAMILGKTFNTDPKIWLYIQDKNEMIRLSKIKQNAYKKYTIDNLVRAAV